MTLLRSIVPGVSRSVSTTEVKPASPAEAHIRPVYNVREDEHGYDVTVQLPGVAKGGLEITAQDDMLMITGRRAWIPPAGWIALYRETPRAHFELTLRHEGDIDADKINAELKNGILHLMLPKAEAAKPRKIAVS